MTRRARVVGWSTLAGIVLALVLVAVLLLMPPDPMAPRCVLGPCAEEPSPAAPARG